MREDKDSMAIDSCPYNLYSHNPKNAPKRIHLGKYLQQIKGIRFKTSR